MNGPFDSHAKGVAVLAEAVAAAALSDLNHLANELYIAYLKHKLGELGMVPRACARPQDQPASNPRSTRTSPRQPPGTRRRQQRPMLLLVEATAVGSYSISKAYRPEFDVRGAPERAPGRDRAVPGLRSLSAVFRSRPQ